MHETEWNILLRTLVTRPYNHNSIHSCEQSLHYWLVGVIFPSAPLSAFGV